MRTLTLILATAFAAAGVLISGPQPITANDEGVICCGGGYGSGGASGSGGEGANISSWVIGAPGGGVQPPGGGSASQCTSWTPAANSSGDVEQGGTSTVRVDPDGVVAALYVRDCGSPPTRQYVWVREETPESLAQAALADMRSRLLIPPEVRLSPPTRAVVNLETWLAAADPGTVSVSAEIPGLSSTTTARVTSTTFDLGNGDQVSCTGVGVAWSESDGDRSAPCGYTYRRADQTGHTTQVAVTLTWSITWSASNGQSGTLASVDSAPAIIDYPVTEIQTIGVEG